MTATASASYLDLASFVPAEVRNLSDPQRSLPQIAKDAKLVAAIEANLKNFPSSHRLQLQDARLMSGIEPESVHLVLTSPSYWTLKEYRDSDGQLGAISDYERFLSELEKVWRHCFRALHAFPSATPQPAPHSLTPGISHATQRDSGVQFRQQYGIFHR